MQGILGFKAKQLFEDSVYKLAYLRNEFYQRVDSLPHPEQPARTDGEVKRHSSTAPSCTA
ncbi:MAG: hypothetical protein H6559_10050 [Lewinellaceae bacterium]|nr:hypothetical protein [Lewinellaceae bacterium]